MFLTTTNHLFAGDPPLPPAGHGSSGNIPGGGASIDGDLIIVLIALFTYAMPKLLWHRKLFFKSKMNQVLKSAQDFFIYLRSYYPANNHREGMAN